MLSFFGPCENKFEAVFHDNRVECIPRSCECVDIENIITWCGCLLKEEEGQYQYKSGVQCCKGQLKLEPGALSLERNLFALFCWVSDTGFGISNEQRFSVRHRRWIDRICDWYPIRAAYNDKCEWRPESMSKQSDGRILNIDLEEASVGRQHNGDKGEVDVSQVKPSHVVDDNGPHSSPHWCSQFLVSFVEC